MYSISRDYCNVYGKNYEDNYSKEKQCPTIIKCSDFTSTTIPTGAVAGTTFTVATLTLNTSCLCDPCVKLEFASNIALPVAAFNISFRVFKQCRNQVAPVPIGPAWDLVTPAAGATITFPFVVCDCEDCYDECCTYTVVARVNVATTAALPINNAILGAVATCRNSCHKKCN